MQSFGQAADHLETDVELPLLDLAEVAAAHLSLERELVLRPALGVAKSSQIGGEGLAQIHPPMAAGLPVSRTSIY